jgi:magnesium-protoporphyrin IX monomethyl ester (oxidative) cyclase
MEEALVLPTDTDSTARARQESLLSPRFYTTDYAAMERLDISPVREEWDQMMAEFERDENRAHFRRVEVRTTRKGVRVRTRNGYLMQRGGNP